MVEAALIVDDIPGPQPAQHLGLLGLPCAARFPVRAERLVFDVVPAAADAEPQAPAAQ